MFDLETFLSHFTNDLDCCVALRLQLLFFFCFFHVVDLLSVLLCITAPSGFSAAFVVYRVSLCRGFHLFLLFRPFRSFLLLFPVLLQYILKYNL